MAEDHSADDAVTQLKAVFQSVELAVTIPSAMSHLEELAKVTLAVFPDVISQAEVEAVEIFDPVIDPRTVRFPSVVKDSMVSVVVPMANKLLGVDVPTPTLLLAISIYKVVEVPMLIVSMVSVALSAVPDKYKFWPDE